MPDVELLDVPDGGDGLDVVVGQPMSGVHREAARARVGRRACQGAECGVALPPGAGVAAGVQLDRGNAERGGAIDGSRVGVDEETDADAGGGETFNGRADLAARALERRAALGGDLLASLGGERRL